MLARKITDETDAYACLEAAQRSGLPRTEWARAHGVDACSLNAWRMNLERRGQRRSPDSPLRLGELVSGEGPVTPANSGIRLVFGELVVEVDRGFDLGTLGRVLDLVAPC